ncbi:MAG: hypothetical protein AB1899_17115 [Pseudomonadota bacterium]
MELHSTQPNAGGRNAIRRYSVDAGPQCDSLSQTVPEEGVEFWFARDLMDSQDYADWKNVQTVIKRAIESCSTTDCAAEDHFRGVTKMVEIVQRSGKLPTRKTGLKADGKQ